MVSVKEWGQRSQSVATRKKIGDANRMRWLREKRRRLRQRERAKASVGYLEIAVYYTRYPNSPDSMADVTDRPVHRHSAGQCDGMPSSGVEPSWVVRLKRAASPPLEAGPGVAP